MGDVTLKVPAEYAERFRDEALFAFGTAGESIDEAYRWSKKAKERGEQAPREISSDELNRLHEAERIFLQAREQEGDLEIEAQAKTLSSAALGCALDAVDDLKGALEEIGGDYHSAVVELEFWQSERERIDSMNGKVA